MLWYPTSCEFLRWYTEYNMSTAASVLDKFIGRKPPPPPPPDPPPDPPPQDPNQPKYENMWRIFFVVYNLDF